MEFCSGKGFSVNHRVPKRNDLTHILYTVFQVVQTHVLACLFLPWRLVMEITLWLIISSLMGLVILGIV